MNALGFIETLGLISSIEAADAMVKSANVSLLKKEYVGKGYVSVIVEGDVSAVQAAVDTGVEAVKALGGKLISCNVIPSPAKELEIFFEDSKTKEDKKALGIELSEDVHQTDKEEVSDISNDLDNINMDEDISEKIDLDVYSIKTKSDVDNVVEKYGISACESILKMITNKQLKKIAAEYTIDNSINLNKSNKKELISLIEEFYKNK